MADRGVQGRLGQAGRAGRDAQPARVQRRQRDGEPVPLLADQVIGGTRAPLKIIWAVTEARMPILRSAGPALTPAVPAGT